MALTSSRASLLLWARNRGKSKSQLYDFLYGMRWGDTTTNNYGFAPAPGENSEKFQFQMYTELYRLLKSSGEPAGGRILEVSCGRGGGLNHLARLWPRRVDAVGLDFSWNAVEFCKTRYADFDNLSFVRANALRLPFGDRCFDVVVNVEASNAYRDDRAFFAEVCRVLVPKGAFLYADSRAPRKVPDLEGLAQETGLSGRLTDITDNVVRACELDSTRRRALIQTGVPRYGRMLLARRLENYAAVPGSKKLEKFRRRDRICFMACLTKSPRGSCDRYTVASTPPST
jgi:ubiquinone/menaquinone biosynthesis C-methylase UbiE